MKRITYYAAALAAVFLMPVFVAAASDAEPKAKSQVEEFLSVSVTCGSSRTLISTVDDLNNLDDVISTLAVSFAGSGDLASGGGRIRLSISVTDCDAAVAAFGAALDGLDLPCESSPATNLEDGIGFSSVCQAARAELVNVMGEVGRALMILPTTPVP